MLLPWRLEFLFALVQNEGGGKRLWLVNMGDSIEAAKHLRYFEVRLKLAGGTKAGLVERQNSLAFLKTKSMDEQRIYQEGKLTER